MDIGKLPFLGNGVGHVEGCKIVIIEYPPPLRIDRHPSLFIADKTGYDCFINRLWGPNTPTDPTRFQGEERNIGTQDIKGDRLKVLYKPIDALVISGSVYHEERSANGLGDYTGGVLNPSQALNQIELADIQEPSPNSFTLSNLTAKLTMGDINITSSSSYYDSYPFITEEGTAVASSFFGVFIPSRFDEHHTDRNITQELRIATVEPIHGFGVIAGLYYNQDHNKRTYSYPAPSGTPCSLPSAPTILQVVCT